MGKKNTQKSKQINKSKKPTIKENSLEFIKTLLIALPLALLIKATVVEAYSVPTPSMEKTVLAGDYVIGNRFIYGIKIPFTDIRLPSFREPERGDIVIFNPPIKPNERYVKRCIGTPGDTIQFIDKRIYINGELYDDSEFARYSDNEVFPLGGKFPDPYRVMFKETGIINDGYRPFEPFRDNSRRIVVPEGKFFMVGDNRDNSLDSRMWGFVDRSDILGELVIVLWSWEVDDPQAPEINWKNPLSIINNSFYNLFHFPERFRWGRICHLPGV